MVCEVMQWLPVTDLARSQLVCRHWHGLLCPRQPCGASRAVWRRAYFNTWPRPCLDHFGLDEDELEIGEARRDRNIKRPKNAFLFFAVEERVNVKEENPELGFSDITKRVAVKWKEMTDDEKEPFLELARRDKERYKVELTSWAVKHQHTSKEEEVTAGVGKEQQHRNGKEEQGGTTTDWRTVALQRLGLRDIQWPRGMAPSLGPNAASFSPRWCTITKCRDELGKVEPEKVRAVLQRAHEQAAMLQFTAQLRHQRPPTSLKKAEGSWKEWFLGQQFPRLFSALMEATYWTHLWAATFWWDISGQGQTKFQPIRKRRMSVVVHSLTTGLPLFISFCSKKTACDDWGDEEAEARDYMILYVARGQCKARQAMDEEEQAELREYASSTEADETDYEDDDDDDDDAGGGKEKGPHYTEEDHVRLMQCVAEFLVGENTSRGQGKGPTKRLCNRMEAFLVAVLALKQLHNLDNLCNRKAKLVVVSPWLPGRPASKATTARLQLTLQ